MERKFQFSVGEYYHVYNRGVDKRKIFLNSGDYKRFLLLLYLVNNVDAIHFRNISKQYQDRGEPSVQMFDYPRGKALTAIGAFCLMPNHFHLLLRETEEGGISKFMLKLQTAYSMYFNTRNERSGALLQGLFKARYADDDAYLKYLFAYIHLNPAKLVNPNWKEGNLSKVERKKLYNYASAYPYSSYPLYLSRTPLPESVIINRQEFPAYFNNGAEFQEEMMEWLSWTEGSPRSE